MSQSAIYLDYAAATPVDKAALDAALQYTNAAFYNPSAVYQSARRVRQAIESARGQVASAIGAKDQEVIFTAGGTEANNIAISGVMQQYPEANIVVSSIEHESVLETAKQYNYNIAPVTEQGFVDLQKLDELIDENTALVSVMYANNEIGSVQPLKEVAALIAKKRAGRSTGLPLYLHTDACQAPNYLDIEVGRLGIDMMTLNGGKIYALKQSGCLYIRRDVALSQMVRGGGQERGIRSGTENVMAITLFATMLQKVQQERKQEEHRLRQMSELFIAKLSQKINIQLNGHAKKRLPNNVNIQLPSQDGERFVMELDELGVMAATGSACTASSDEPSHVLKALGLTDAEASSSLRLTLGRGTTEAEVVAATEAIIRIVESGRALV